MAHFYGCVIREFRDQAGITQEELAYEANFDRSYPSLLERGLRTPTLTVILEIADVLKVNAAKMVQETQDRMERG